jgi:hypothetical protein
LQRGIDIVRPEWMSIAPYAALPDELTLREVRIRVVVVPAKMGRGIAFAEPEDRFANGSIAMQDAGACSQRVLDASARLQSDSRRDGCGGLGVGPIAVGDQFQGNASNT